MIWRLGQLNQRVSLQRVTETDDGAGGATESWAEYAEVWAHVRPLVGRERDQAMREEATSDYLVVIRYRAGILAGDRILWNGRYLNIRFPRYEGVRVQFLEIEAEIGKGS